MNTSSIDPLRTGFEISRLPRVIFGSGCDVRIPDIVAQYGRKVLIVTGAQSFLSSPHWPMLHEAMQKQRCEIYLHKVTAEPSPQMVDEAAQAYRDIKFDVVLGIGGGSVLDAAKAIAGLLKGPNSVMDYLEGVGPELPYAGDTVPFIAVPTTAGTGSEATKNAVLSVQGPQGFKKSFRHENLVPQYAVLDPEFLTTCPRNQIAANGMDALTQLVESYVSVKANPFTDALALSGIQAIREGLFQWLENTGDAAQGRANMAYAAWLSGVTLAQAGLGSVHGLAAPLGAFFPIPHGVACGTMLAACTRGNIVALQQREPNSGSLYKYAEVGRLLANQPQLKDETAREDLLERLERWTVELDMPLLSTFGMRPEDVPKVVANCRGNSMKTNPVVVTDEEVADMLLSRL